MNYPNHFACGWIRAEIRARVNSNPVEKVSARAAKALATYRNSKSPDASAALASHFTPKRKK